MREFKTLYDVTGDIKDINTLLVTRTELKEIQKDGELLDFLQNNFYSEENLDWVTGKVVKETYKWVFYAPSGVQSDIRDVLDAAKSRYEDRTKEYLK